uniref:Uncharacterized protein n=1 Tax=Angiostrongylus cantonensis TaxID=6313 RepID=A0A0K0DPM5_ANGCA
MKDYLLDFLFGSREVDNELLISVLLSIAFLPEPAGEAVAGIAADSHDTAVFHFEFDNDYVQRQEMPLASPESPYKTSTSDSAVRAAADSQYNDVIGFEYDSDYLQQVVLLNSSELQYGAFISESVVSAESNSQFNEVFDFEYDDDSV